MVKRGREGFSRLWTVLYRGVLIAKTSPDPVRMVSRKRLDDRAIVQVAGSRRNQSGEQRLVQCRKGQVRIRPSRFLQNQLHILVMLRQPGLRREVAAEHFLSLRFHD